MDPKDLLGNVLPFYDWILQRGSGDGNLPKARAVR